MQGETPKPKTAMIAQNSDPVMASKSAGLPPVAMETPKIDQPRESLASRMAGGPQPTGGADSQPPMNPMMARQMLGMSGRRAT